MLWTMKHWARVMGPCAGSDGDLLFKKSSVNLTRMEEFSFGPLFNNGSVEKTVAPTNASAKVAADGLTQSVVTGRSSAVQLKVPADVTVEPLKVGIEIVSPNSLTSERTRSVGSEDVPQPKIGVEVATEITLSKVILKQIVAEVGGTVGNLAEEPRPPEEEVRSEVRTKTSTEEVKPLPSPTSCMKA
ncbi:hypothetical protein AXG93_2795s1000 [Marchantia polymorpha subsp. ruderalis]|uniref:Uncharacterized protein n=1 Tax=Marchantia polymorpha subsp. ruderalis TaxID=1480154 RepID=A0A176VET0_MARPO|nr:hypothetical protein AXG93_2795s1000 [Marchantia polymorpha subsp. ruderalis]